MTVALLVVAVLTLQTPVDTTGAYLDAAARQLVAAARSRRETVDRSITAYETTLRERLGIGIRALRRDRMLYRRELALRIHWRRDSLGSITVLGAREAVPAALPKPSMPDSVQHEVKDYAFDPADDRLTIGFGDEDQSPRDSSARHRDVQFSHPLAPGAERDYRYASGDSSVITFSGGRTIRLRELRVTPRRLDFGLMTGSLWIDEDSHAVVRALIRPARPFDFERDLDENDATDIPGFVKPIRIDVRFVTIDYGLSAGHWWLPRLIAMDAVATAGSFLQVPMRYELEYSDYTVTGDTAQPLERRVAETTRTDSVTRARCKAQGPHVECRCRHGACRGFVVTVPADTQALLASADLPPAFQLGDSLLTPGDMADLSQALGRLPAPPWQFHARPPRWGLARYNRVEGLSLGARAELDLGRLRADGAARIATTDGTPDLEAGVTRETETRRIRLAGYYRLAAVDPAAHSLSIGNSLGALLLGRDDGDYFRARGAELTIRPPVTLPQAFELRLFAERQRLARKWTDVSLPHALHSDHLFRPNIVADSADQVGASLTFRAQRGIDPAHTQWETDLTLDGQAGTFGFGRASGTLRITRPLGRTFAGALELSGGTTAGRVPVQSLWYLGGPTTLRGYGGNATRGDAFWRARAELANRWPAARVVVFTDIARAASRDHLSLAHPLEGAGVGASFLDGLIRVDLTRAVRSPTGWRLDFYTDAAL